METRKTYFLEGFVSSSRFRFLIIGGLAFLIDTGLLWVINYRLDITAWVSKLISFFVALSFTYFGNRFYTFADARKCLKLNNMFANYGSYCISQLAGAGLNVVLFSFMTNFGFPLFVSAVISAAGGVFLNYVMAKMVIVKSNIS